MDIAGTQPVIPDCYKLPQPPPLASKMPYLSDDSLFFIFYSMPRDALQESAAQELYNRNWRYHKELKTWLTKEPNAPDSLYTKTAQFEKGVYLFWDVGRWCKVSKEFVLHYDLIEDRLNAGGSSPGTFVIFC
jgi:CCR4-NOT transcription complex subunit 2